MSMIAIAICLVNITALWGLGKHVQAKRNERARNAWLDRQAARAVEEARRGVDYFPRAHSRDALEAA